MERRRFLKNLVIGAVSTTLPLKLISDVHNKIPIAEPWEIDYTTKHIIYKGGLDDGFSLCEFYNFLRNEWNEKIEEFPFEKPNDYTSNMKGFKLLYKI